MLLRYIIIDDNQLDRVAVESEAAKFSFLEKIASCAHPLEGFEMIRRFSPDIVFLDIEMPVISGTDLISNKLIRSAVPVLITSHPEFAIEGFDLDAFDYLVKPFTSDRFAQCARKLQDFFHLREKAFAFEDERNDDFLVVKQGHDKHKLLLKEILYLEAMKDYTRVRTRTTQYLVLSTLTGLLEQLPPDRFLRVHRSYAVNRENVAVVEKSMLRIADHEIPIGKLYKAAVRTLLTS